MTIVAAHPIRSSVHTWLAKTPFLALILAIAALSPLASFQQTQQQQQQQSTLAADSVQSLKAGFNPLKSELFTKMGVFLATVVGIGVAAAGTVIGAVNFFKVVDPLFYSGPYPNFTPALIRMFVGIGILAIGVCILMASRHWWKNRTTGDDIALTGSEF